MSYGHGNAGYASGYPQYSESDILDFITNGEGDLGQDDAFGKLEGAEDMMFGGFGNFATQGSAFDSSGLGSSTDMVVAKSEYHPEEHAPQSQHASFVASSSVGVSSFRDHNARARLEQQQLLTTKQEAPVTPLRDTPHTPTNLDFRASAMPSILSSNVKMVAVPSAHTLGVPRQRLDTGQAQESESMELHEFIAVGSQETDATLNAIQLEVQSLQRRIDEMRLEQTQLLQSMCENLVSEQNDNAHYVSQVRELLSVQNDCMSSVVVSSQERIFELLQTKVLTSAEVERSSSLFDEVGYLGAHLQVMSQELVAYDTWIGNGEAPTLSMLTALVIARAPFPSIWMKRNQMSEQEAVHVKLLHGCSVTLTSVSEVKATIHSHSNYTAKTTPAKSVIDVDLFAMDPSTLTASCQFVFTGGSRKDVAQTHFEITIQGSSFATSVLLNRGNDVPNQEVCQLVSQESKPFIIITNESQYGETFGILFSKDVFHYQWWIVGQGFGQTEASKGEVPWPLVANALQRYFIRASRQDATMPKRGLSVYDLEHIHAHFFQSAPQVEARAFAKFWDWFGKVLHRLRYQRHVSALWTEGLIFGMVGREGVCEQLISRSPGTFLLRFSESSAGFIAVGYRVSGANAGIKNYLVKQEDTASSTVKTLPDFIRSRPEFSVILQYTGQHLEDGFPVLYPIHKDYALKAYCAAKPQKVIDPKAGSPYDEL